MLSKLGKVMSSESLFAWSLDHEVMSESGKWEINHFYHCKAYDFFCDNFRVASEYPSIHIYIKNQICNNISLKNNICKNLSSISNKV